MTHVSQVRNRAFMKFTGKCAGLQDKLMKLLNKNEGTVKLQTPERRWIEGTVRL